MVVGMKLRLLVARSKTTACQNTVVMALVHYTYGAINCTGRQRLFADGQTIIVTVYGHVLNDAEAPGVLATRPVIGFDANPIVRRIAAVANER